VNVLLLCGCGCGCGCHRTKKDETCGDKANMFFDKTQHGTHVDTPEPEPEPRPYHSMVFKIPLKWHKTTAAPQQHLTMTPRLFHRSVYLSLSAAA